MILENLKKLTYIVNTVILIMVFGLMGFFYIIKASFLVYFSIPTARVCESFSEMRYPKIIDELNDSVVTVIQLVLTIHNPIAFVKNYVRMIFYVS